MMGHGASETGPSNAECSDPVLPSRGQASDGGGRGAASCSAGRTSSSPRSRSGVTRLLVGVATLVLLAAACGTDDDDPVEAGTPTTAAPTTAATDDVDTTTSTQPDEPDEPTATTEVRAYLVRDEAVAPVARTADSDATGAAAMEGLLAGPTAEEQAIGFDTAVPEGTELLGLDIADGVATVDLSEAFTDTAGSARVRAQVAQVVFTLTQFPTVDAVLFAVEGEPLEVLAGEGLMLDEPQTRYDWEDLAPAVLVESPLPFAEVSLPLRLVGSASVFEGTFNIRVIVDDDVIYEDFATAADRPDDRPDAIFRNDFDVTVDVDVAGPTSAVLELFERSARDGSEVNNVEIPITIGG